MHGGRIRAESAGPGRSATFTFTVPVAGEAGAMAVGRAAGPPPAADWDGPPRILVVDNDPKMLRFVRGALSAVGYAPLVTGGPEDLAHIIWAEKPQLVLLDLVLPASNGIELKSRSRSCPTCRSEAGCRSLTSAPRAIPTYDVRDSGTGLRRSRVID